jgi:hypothetical protein
MVRSGSIASALVLESCNGAVEQEAADGHREKPRPRLGLPRVDESSSLIMPLALRFPNWRRSRYRSLRDSFEDKLFPNIGWH